MWSSVSPEVRSTEKLPSIVFSGFYPDGAMDGGGGLCVPCAERAGGTLAPSPPFSFGAMRDRATGGGDVPPLRRA